MAGTGVNRVLQGADLDRARVLHAEGMPMTWIAEDLDCRRASLRASGIGEDPAATKEWMSAWSKIRRSDILSALHREFAPNRKYSS